MTRQQHMTLTRIAVRQRREWLLGLIAGMVLILSWSVTAQLDARPYPQALRRSAISDFDAAFLAANAGPTVDRLSCSDVDCAARVAQADPSQPRL